ncbi:S41 family peptidase, partial [Acinetobacter baumannii]
GYIRIDSFSSDTAERFREAIGSFSKEPSLRSLIVDVRGNPGGYLDAVQEVASVFIESGPLLHTIDRNGTQEAVKIEDGNNVGVPV